MALTRCIVKIEAEKSERPECSFICYWFSATETLVSMLGTRDKDTYLRSFKAAFATDTHVVRIAHCGNSARKCS